MFLLYVRAPAFILHPPLHVEGRDSRQETNNLAPAGDPRGELIHYRLLHELKGRRLRTAM